jgi:hypothetical protein
MSDIILRCPASKGCGGRIRTVCKAIDQILICPICKLVFTFTNVGTIYCRKCGNAMNILLNTRYPGGICTSCRTQADLPSTVLLEAGVNAFRFEHEDTVQYCGRNAFGGLETEVGIAKAALNKVESRTSGSFSKKSLPKTMLINTWPIVCRQYEQLQMCGVEQVRGVHGYCSFKYYPDHENAKFLGFPAGFADGRILTDFFSKKGGVEIWFTKREMREEFARMPALTSFAERFKSLE